VLARVLVAALAVVAAVVAIQARRSNHDCAAALLDVADAPRGQLAALGRTTTDRCGDPRDRGIVAVGLVARGQRPAAVALLRRMTTSEPDDYLGWFLLGRLEHDRAALARAHELNPRVAPAP
jgi:hypothetical protein